ncbi:MAG TPA: carbamate kinase [Phycisphaerae bacterium]|nr:carbamate kinase [Phycisphaerae bacterium]HNU45119.1 carbamate kinase [Phycisphaerae bacterium]
MAQSKLIVVALGGNAISKPDQQGNVAEQFANSRATARQLADLIEQGYQLLVTHGNGPQIGNFLLRNEAGAGLIYPLPMEVAVAHVQGGMGYMIAQTLSNELRTRNLDRIVSTIITTVLLDRADPAFANPTKPVGRVFDRADADRFAREGWHIKEVEPGKFRRVVPSPLPRQIMEIELIREAVAAGHTLIACGGGGVPVVRHDDGDLTGTAAVIDKDLASALLAAQLGAAALLILTAIEAVCVNYNRADARRLDRMTVSEARRWLAEGQFPPGSMGPKIQGAIDFLSAETHPDAFVAIGPLERALDTLAGRVGTRITHG